MLIVVVVVALTVARGAFGSLAVSDFIPNPDRLVWQDALGAIPDPLVANEIWTVNCDSCSLFLHVNYVKAYVSSTNAHLIVDGAHDVAMGISGSVGISIERIAIVVYPFCDPNATSTALIGNNNNATPTTWRFNRNALCVFTPHGFPARQVLLGRIMESLRNYTRAPLFSYVGTGP